MRVVFYETASGKRPVEEFIRGLSKADQARFVDVFAGIREWGLDCPRVTFRQLKGKLWEIRFKGEASGYRVAYVIVKQPTMVWLHAFKKKTQKTAKKDMEIALKRMKEVF